MFVGQRPLRSLSGSWFEDGFASRENDNARLDDTELSFSLVRLNGRDERDKVVGFRSHS